MYVVTVAVLMLMSVQPAYTQFQNGLCYSPFDAVFIVDNSGSIRDNNPADNSYDNWDLILNFMREFVLRFNVGNGNRAMKAAAVDFGHTGMIRFPFQSDRDTLTSFFVDEPGKMPYRNDRQSTNTADGIAKALTLLGDQSLGDRALVRDVFIIITDGRATNSTLAISLANEAKNNYGVTVYCIGVTTNADESEIIAYASSENGYWLVPNFLELDAAVDGITSDICIDIAIPTSALPTTTTTPTPTIPARVTTAPKSSVSTTPVPQVVTTSLVIVPAAAASTSSNTTLIAVLVVLGIILFLALLLLLLACCCYGPIAACCVACCGAAACCKKDERLIDKRRAIIVPFSTAVVKPADLHPEEPVYAHMTTQCDLREPVPLPKPLLPPEVKKEVIKVIKSVCSKCKRDIEKCRCNEMILSHHHHCNHHHNSHSITGCPHCYMTSSRCPMSHNNNHFGLYDNNHSHNRQSHGYSGCDACENSVGHSHDAHCPICYRVDYHRPQGAQRAVEYPIYKEQYETEGYQQKHKRKYRPYAEQRFNSTHRSEHSTCTSDVESCSSRIYLVPQKAIQSSRMNTIEPISTIERGDTVLRVHSVDSMDDEIMSAGRKRKKKRRKRLTSKEPEVAEIGAVSDIDSTLPNSKKSYVYIPLDCPEKLKEDAQAYLNKLYNGSALQPENN